MDDTISLFDDPTPDWSGEWTVRRVSLATAKDWFPQYHYSGTCGTNGAQFFGVYAPDLLIAVAIGPTANIHGLQKRFHLEDFVGNWEVTRVARHPDADQPNVVSRALTMVLAHFHQLTGVEWVFSYADTGQNHHGGIYQAVNAAYVGVSKGSAGFTVDGVPVHPRTIVEAFGTSSWPALQERFTDDGTIWHPTERRNVVLEKVANLNTDKHTYIIPIGDRRSRKAIRRLLAPHVQPYPKREEVA